MEFFKIRRTIPFMRYALIFNVISLITFLAAVFFLISTIFVWRSFYRMRIGSVKAEPAEVRLDSVAAD